MNKISNKYEESKAYFSLAGSGDPWSCLTKTRKNILRALHNRIPIEDIAAIFSLSMDDLLPEIKPMIESSLVQKEGISFVPTFLIVHLAFPPGGKFSMISVSNTRTVSFDRESFKTY